jgi:hypothetical protein
LAERAVVLSGFGAFAESCLPFPFRSQPGSRMKMKAIFENLALRLLRKYQSIEIMVFPLLMLN